MPQRSKHKYAAYLLSRLCALSCLLPFPALTRAFSSNARIRGQMGEQMACDYLRRSGYDIIARNVKAPRGELDIIARRGDVLSVIEVRLRSEGSYATAAGSVTAQKRARLIKATRWYLARIYPRWRGAVRFDVVTVDMPRAGRPMVRLITDAFALT